MATLGMSEGERAAIAKFEAEVIQPSMKGLVLLQFTADWCGPCKQLSPILDKVAADYAGKGVTLARIDVDKNKEIAAQFRIQSVPTVFAIFQGQPVADLTQYRSEGQIGQALDQILGQLPVEGEEQDLKAKMEPLIAQAEQVLEKGDAQSAAAMFEQLRTMAPDDLVLAGGLARAMIAGGRTDEAKALLDSLGPEAENDAAIGRARAALEIAETPEVDTSEDEKKLAANPDDHEARFAIANAALGAGDRDKAADELLEIIKRDREWNDGAAHKQLLQILEAAGFEDPWGREVRRKLSALLFT